MKSILCFFILFHITLLSADDSNETVTSRLEDGYGNSAILSDSMPYLPEIKNGESVQFLGDLRLRSQTIKRSSEEIIVILN